MKIIREQGELIFVGDCQVNTTTGSQYEITIPDNANTVIMRPSGTTYIGFGAGTDTQFLLSSNYVMQITLYPGAKIRVYSTQNPIYFRYQFARIEANNG